MAVTGLEKFELLVVVGDILNWIFDIQTILFFNLNSSTSAALSRVDVINTCKIAA